MSCVLLAEDKDRRMLERWIAEAETTIERDAAFIYAMYIRRSYIHAKISREKNRKFFADQAN